jgi:hypothetical protein
LLDGFHTVIAGSTARSRARLTPAELLVAWNALGVVNVIDNLNVEA